MEFVFEIRIQTIAKTIQTGTHTNAHVVIVGTKGDFLPFPPITFNATERPWALPNALLYHVGREGTSILSRAKLGRDDTMSSMTKLG